MSTTSAIKNAATSIKFDAIKVDDVRTHATAAVTKALHVGAGAGDLALATVRTKAAAVVGGAKERALKGVETVTTTYRGLAERGENVLARKADTDAGAAEAPVVTPADS